MSTRRARIKAVASLPVRRKNLDTNENKISHCGTEVSTPKQTSVSASNPAETLPTTSSTTPQKTTKTPTHVAKPEIINNLIDNNKSDTIDGICKIAVDSRPSTSKNDIDGIVPLQTIPKYSKPVHILRNELINEPSTSKNDIVDGIVPLQTIPKSSKPVHILRNELINDNTDVLFDPIVPLPSPSKVRPKLRPTPRLASFRRNSIQGSASESEDESRRAALATNIVTPIQAVPPRQRHDSQSSISVQSAAPAREVNHSRHDSVCSQSSNITTPLVPSSPFKEKQQTTRPKRIGQSRRPSGIQRRQKAREGAKPKEVLTMYDLIFYNPTANPIVHDKDEAEILNEQKETAKNNSEDPDDQQKEEQIDDPPPVEKEDAAPVPQIKIGANGEIVLDEKSLVINQTEGSRKLSNKVVHEGEWALSGKGRYTRMPRTAEWSHDETVRFYRALATVGTDFSLMAGLFPHRLRRDLKLKFKKEERTNGALVDKALMTNRSWDLNTLMSEFEQQRKTEAVVAEKERLLKENDNRHNNLQRLQKLRESGLKLSKASKSIDTIVKRKDAVITPTADEVFRGTKIQKRVRKVNKSPTRTPTKTPTEIIQPTLTPMATITPLSAVQTLETEDTPSRYATVTKITKPNTPQIPNVNTSSMPRNIENGSLVILTVDDPKTPSKKMLQTYISDGKGSLTPVALPESLLSSVLGYMKHGTPKSVITSSSPRFMSPSSVASQDSRSNTPGVIQVNPSPNKRLRHDSYSVTHL